MSTTPDAHDQHYASADIAERILAAYHAIAGPDAPLTPEALAPLDQFHGGGLDSTRSLARAIEPEPGQHLIDIGCGIGGPARWFAATFGCRVSGVDLTEAFCVAARRLDDELGLGEQVTIHHGNALALPFAAATFDGGYSQNVAMNIPDKIAYYREALRVLKPGARIGFSVLGLGPHGGPDYPTPWASTAAESFLVTVEETRSQMLAAGAEILHFEDTTERDRPNTEKMIRRLEAKGAPSLSLNVLMGARFTTLQLNGARARVTGRCSNVEAVLRKPA